MLASTAKVAETLKLSTRRVRQLVELGLPREKPGQFDLAKCMLWYIRHLQKELERRHLDSSAESTALRAQRLRLLKAQAEREEHGLRLLSGQFIPKVVYQKFIAQVRGHIAKRSDPFGAGIAPRLVGLNREEIKIVLDEEIRGLLNSLAR